MNSMNTKITWALAGQQRNNSIPAGTPAIPHPACFTSNMSYKCLHTSAIFYGCHSVYKQKGM